MTPEQYYYHNKFVDSVKGRKEQADALKTVLYRIRLEHPEYVNREHKEGNDMYTTLMRLEASYDTSH